MLKLLTLGKFCITVYEYLILYQSLDFVQTTKQWMMAIKDKDSNQVYIGHKPWLILS